MGSFPFSPLIDPKNPPNPSDPPPVGWDMKIKPKDYRNFKNTSEIFQACVEWQTRQLNYLARQKI